MGGFENKNKDSSAEYGKEIKKEKESGTREESRIVPKLNESSTEPS